MNLEENSVTVNGDGHEYMWLHSCGVEVRGSIRGEDPEGQDSRLTGAGVDTDFTRPRFG